MIEVRAGSRLHFGLLNPGRTEPGERRFGGAGMIIDSPGICLRIEPADQWTAEGPLAERALSFARHFNESLAASTGRQVPAQRIHIMSVPPDHVGLGTGTQLGMAVARAMSLAVGMEDAAAVELAAMVGRGLRSAIGIHGFDAGGFLVDGGQSTASQVAPLVARMNVPDDWRVLLLIPSNQDSWHGQRERQAFEGLQATSSAHVDRLCRLLLMGLLPALAERDLPAFGEQLHEFNVLSGEAFASLQGGCFAGRTVAEAVELLRKLGVRGAGQSSWGPTVFGIVGADEADELRRRLDEMSGSATWHIAAPWNGRQPR